MVTFVIVHGYTENLNVNVRGAIITVTVADIPKVRVVQGTYKTPRSWPKTNNTMPDISFRVPKGCRSNMIPESFPKNPI